MTATGRPFVLDRVENPHPRMLAEGWQLRAVAEQYDVEAYPAERFQPAVCRWRGYLQAMCAATGCEEADILAWMDRHPPVPSTGGSTLPA